MHRRTRSVLAGAACVLPMLAHVPAFAATTSVEGTESFTKLVLANQQNAVVVKMFAPGGKGEVRWLNATVRDKDGTKYKVQGGWYGESWVVSLAAEDLVECDGLKLVYNSDKGFWKATLPRPCLDDLAGKVKVTYAEVNDGSPTPGSAGPTKYVARG